MIITRKRALTTIRQILVELNIDVSNLRMKSNCAELGLSKDGFLKLVRRTQTRLNIRLEKGEIRELKCIGDAVRCIEGKETNRTRGTSGC